MASSPASASQHGNTAAAATGGAAGGAAGTPVQPVHKNPVVASQRCQQWVDDGLSSNKTIQFLLQTLTDLGCLKKAKSNNHDNFGFIHCYPCEHPAAGRFNMIREETSSCQAVSSSLQQLEQQHQQQQSSVAQTSPAGSMTTTTTTLQPEIEICQQYMDSRSMTHKTMIHELVHAIDMCRVRNMDPVHNCLHMACTEIRAENLSGECNFWPEVGRGQAMPLGMNAGQGKQCVQRRALLSVQANPNCQANAADYVHAAMKSCYQDVYPFDRHPRQQPWLRPFQKSREERPAKANTSAKFSSQTAATGSAADSSSSSSSS